MLEMKDCKTDKELLVLLERSVQLVAEMTPDERANMYEAQAQSWVRSSAPCEHGNEWEYCDKCWQTVQ